MDLFEISRKERLSREEAARRLHAFADDLARHNDIEFERDGLRFRVRVPDKIAEISKRWFRFRDTYGIEITPGADDALIVAAAVCIDEMTHD